MPFAEPAAVAVAMILVTIPAAILFLVDTFVRRDLPAGRVWAFGFLALAADSIGHLAAASIDDGAWIGVVLADTCLVAFFGTIWAGAVRFNRQPTLPASITSGSLVLASLLASLLAALAPLPLARELVVPAAVAALAILSAVALRRGRTAVPETLLLVIGLVVVAAVALLVLVVHALPGLRAAPEPLRAFDLVDIPLVTAPLALVAVATLMLLRAGDRLGPASQRARGELRLDEDGLLDQGSFDEAVAMFVRRAERTGEQVAVLAMVATDLPEIGAALGGSSRERLERAWRESWVRHIPIGGIPGLGGPDRLLLVIAPSTLGEANRIGNRVYSRVVEDLARLEGTTLPMTGFGAAISGALPDGELVARACAAAERSTSGAAAGQLVAEGEDLIERTLGGRE